MQALPMIAAIGGTAVSLVGMRKQARAQKTALKLQRQQADLQARQERRRAFRQAQAARARSAVMAGAGGTTASSGFAGGVGAISSQLGAGLGFSSQMQGLGVGINRAQQAEANGQALAGFGSTMASIGTNAGGWDWMKPSGPKLPTTGVSLD